MKMRAFSILICAAMIFSLTACGDSGKTDAELPAMGGEAPMIQQTDEQPADSPEAPETEPEANESEETEPEATEPEVAGSKDPMDILYEKLLSLSFEDGTVYDENGMTVTCEGFAENLEEWALIDHVALLLNVSNQNPDNKKMFFEIQDVLWNGLAYSASAYWGYDADIEWGLNSESEAKAYIFFYKYGDEMYGIESAYEPLEESLNGLGIDISQYPIETVTIRYRVMVGSDSEWEERTAVLKTNEYQDGDFTKYLGECVGTEFDDYGSIFEIYAKCSDSGLIASAVSYGDELYDILHEPTVLVNDKIAYSLNNEALSEGWLMGLYLYDWAVIFKTSKTDDEIRKEYEIPNDEPIEIKLVFDGYDKFGNDAVFVIYTSN